jgi:hypothetical protein
MSDSYEEDEYMHEEDEEEDEDASMKYDTDDTEDNEGMNLCGHQALSSQQHSRRQ